MNILKLFVSRVQSVLQSVLTKNMHDPYVDLKYKIKCSSPVVIDGGAHEGETADLLLDTFSNPTVHCFEPQGDKFSLLKNKFESTDNVRLYNCALGKSNEERVFHVMPDTYLSSMLKPTEKYTSMFDKMDGDESKDVRAEVRKLDDVVSQNIDIIKLDLQGFELEALKGAKKSLSQARAVLLEVMFNENYEGQPVFGDIDDFMTRSHYKLYRLYNIKHWPSGKVRHADALYFKDNTI